MSTVINIYENILKYNDEPITIIIGDSIIPWYSAVDVGKILDYKQNIRRAIVTHVDAEFKKTFKDLEKFVFVKPKNAQPQAVYINEFGLYQLLFKSHQPHAKEFLTWIFNEVNPIIRKLKPSDLFTAYENRMNELIKAINDNRIKNDILRAKIDNAKNIEYALKNNIH